jgi:COP9 signalosome complex subunit 4
MRLLLEDDDSVTAENFLGRTGTLVNSISQATATVEEKTMMLHYKTCQARIFDSRRKFLEAAAKYYALSTEGAIDEEERLACL